MNWKASSNFQIPNDITTKNLEIFISKRLPNLTVQKGEVHAILRDELKSTMYERIPCGCIVVLKPVQRKIFFNKKEV